MKERLLLSSSLSLSLLLIVALVHPGEVMSQSEIIHYWNFNDPSGTSPTWPQPVSATLGSGEITYTFEEDNVASFAGTTLNAQGGDPAGGSFSPQGGTDLVNNGRHFELSVPTTGYEDIVFAYATRGTGTGFDEHTVFYSIDGSTWTQFDQRAANQTATWTIFSYDLSSIADANNNSDFRLRVSVDGASGPSGNNRFDNITIEGTEIEELDICDDLETVPFWDDDENPITSNNDGSGYFIVDVPAGFLAVELITEDSENITLLEPYDGNCDQIGNMGASGDDRPPGIAAHAPGNTEWTYEGTDDITTVCIRIANEHAGPSGFMVRIWDRCERHLQIDPLIALSGDVAELPADFKLEANYPNPFNPSTTIRFHLPQSEHVTLTVYNLLGREVRQVASGSFDAGIHTVAWDGRDDTGVHLASGVYLYRINAGSFAETKRMMLVK